MATYTYRLTGDPRSALATSLDALRGQKYEVTQDSEWSATAEIGSSGRVALLGAFAPHIRLTVSVATRLDGAAITLAPTTTGAVGGLIGMNKVKKAVTSAGEGVQQALDTTGQLAGIQVT